MARSPAPPAALTRRQRALLLRSLARLETAGVPADRAVASLENLLGRRHAGRFRTAAGLVAGGRPVSDAAGRQGLLSVRDRRLLALAERAGALARAADRLARAHEQRARLWDSLRARLLLPLGVLALGLLLLPLPALAGGRIGPAEYVLRAFGPLVALALAAAALLRLGRRAGQRGLSRGAGRLALGLPLVGTWLGRLDRLELLEGLCLLLEAGRPAREALEAALGALGNAAARTRFGPALDALRGGRRLSDALAACGALEGTEFALLSASEEAGRLEDGLQRIAAALRGKLEASLAQAGEWLPRLAYAVVAAVLAAGLLG